MTRVLSSLMTVAPMVVGSFVTMPGYASSQLPVSADYETQQVLAQTVTSDICTNSFIDTGISVRAGDALEIKASGTVRFGFFVGSGGPEGIFIDPDYNYFIDVPHGSLLGRISRPGIQDFDGWFLVGEGINMVAESSGVLQFIVNDNDYNNNAGQFCIEVTNSSSGQT
ncbi:MAG: hypothetical protein HC886_13685 [Leptolyngbyaceae cyanobacterium SM1_1_3]|nr:hypothetical protein [Leptolyngbyaceae cyanobacterium SM1_1_3]NJN04278.1 hypothetical protein [Leptolyngbyaceae cyanobacterium RM1_1_2]NJO08505.1 hypothetical protein [Leptolyngbyaceae cyanobacterium SL_1_1]